MRLNNPHSNEPLQGNACKHRLDSALPNKYEWSTRMPNEALNTALAEFDAVEKRYVQTLENKGLAFADKNSDSMLCAKLRARLIERGAVSRNGGASLSIGHLSPACVECTGNRGSETFSTTFKCHRDCYFCFNRNQPDYERFFNDGCPWEEGLERSMAENETLACVGLTGGEPLLDLENALALLRRTGTMWPEAHKRMYTSGDLLTEESASRLRDAGLNEIRFSIKDDDSPDQRERVLAAMRLAKRFIPSVMVEMPVIPGARLHMQGLFRSLRRSESMESICSSSASLSLTGRNSASAASF